MIVVVAIAALIVGWGAGVIATRWKLLDLTIQAQADRDYWEAQASEWREEAFRRGRGDGPAA